MNTVYLEKYITTLLAKRHYYNKCLLTGNKAALLFLIFMYFLFWKKQTRPWLGRENKPKPWQPINLQKYNKKKQEYNNK